METVSFPRPSRSKEDRLATVRWLTRLVVFAVAVSGCGGDPEVAVPDVSRPAPAMPDATVSRETSATTGQTEQVEEGRRLPALTVGPLTSVEPTWLIIDTTAPRAATAPEPNEWLAPAVTPVGLRLIVADRYLVSDRGAGDCPPTLPSATLTYDTDDLARRRSLRIVQTAPGVSGGPGPRSVMNGQERTLGGREVRAEDRSGDTVASIVAEWAEPNGNNVTVSALGFTWNELDAIIAGLEPVNASDWPDVPVEPRLARCIDASSQYAPTAIPDGWQRAVLEIHPTGTCDVPIYLMMSLVEPGTDSGPGTLVTIAVMPASDSTPQPGSPIVINGREAVIHEAGNSIDLLTGSVAINVHGNADTATLQQIVATIGPVDDTQWAQLVAEIARP
jgi:hypothetical protein